VPRMENVNDGKTRCGWALLDPLLLQYHDLEWGVPVHDDSRLFEFLILEGAQAGLSWLTILKKRENYRRAFDHFDPEKISRYSEKRIQKLKENPGIIRNELKIRSAVKNANCLLEVREEFGTFDKYIWTFAGEKKKIYLEIPAKTIESDEMSNALKQRGFGFVGSTICYSFMQAVGMVNDHLTTCYRASEV
jgi:DNA-3-methyladenine glycosylase I